MRLPKIGDEIILHIPGSGHVGIDDYTEEERHVEAEQRWIIRDISYYDNGQGLSLALLHDATGVLIYIDHTDAIEGVYPLDFV